MFKNLLAAGAWSGFLCVALGAFGAHALKESLTDYQHIIYNKAVQYQMFHTVAVFITVILFKQTELKIFQKAAWLFLLGILFFSGSLYVLACKDLLNISNTTFIGPVTPLGGLLFLSGWIMVFVGALRIKFNKH